jgi:hypothetical protein
MPEEASRKCSECEGEMSPVVVMDRNYKNIQQLAYRQLGDKVSFWTGKYATAGTVLSYMCGNCGRIALYGAPPEAGS